MRADGVRPAEGGIDLSTVPFEVRRDAPDPLYTFDCAWCCGVDLLRAVSRKAVGTVTLPFRDFPRQLTADVAATVYAVDEVNPFGQRLRGHIAVASYHGGWLVWLASDLGCDPLDGEGLG